jgi:hypothetical protein
MAIKCKKGTPCGGACIRTGAKCKKQFKPDQSEALDLVKKKIGLGVKIKNAQRKGDVTEEARLRDQRAALSNQGKKGKVAAPNQKLEELESRRNALLDAGIRAAKAGDNTKYGQLQEDFIKVQKEINVMKGIAIPTAPPVPAGMKKELAALAKRDQEIKGKGRTTREQEDLSRIMRGESPKYMDIVSAPGSLGMEAFLKTSGGKTVASGKTKAARKSAAAFDKDIKSQELRRDGDKSFDKWDETSGTGAKKLGSGAFGTVIKSPDGSYAVKRGDVSDSEARLIQKLGEKDLGPKLIAADLDGPGYNLAPGVDNRRGRMAMSVVPGRPIGKSKPDKEVGGVKVADAYWKARADLHRMGIAHNDMHIDNVLVDKNGKGRFVDMGLAQGMPKAALSEALGAFDKPRDGVVTRPQGVKGQGDWQARRWEGTGGQLLSRAGRSDADRRELEKRAPLAHKARDNKTEVMIAMRRDGLNNDDIATIMDHGLRNNPSTYNEGVWTKVTDDQAMKYINILYDGI